jgi:hypothetical protein
MKNIPQPINTISEEQAALYGSNVAKFLNIKKKKNGRYDTAWGSKTDLGLWLSIVEITNSPDTLVG